jgi:L-alanine-DL-glutamate epimerase-like enolase superfamily enzyme
MIGCFAESRLGLTAAAHLACARPNIAFLDLDSALNLNSDPVLGGIIYDEVNGGNISLPETPGLGASIGEAFLSASAHYSVTA